MGEFAVNDQVLEVEQAIYHLYQNRMFTDVDVILSPGDEVFYAHKLILAFYSPVLCDRFYGKNSNGSDKLYVKDIDICAVSNMISYCYGESLVLDTTFQIQETKKLADEYKIDELGNKCKMKIYELDVDASNVLMVLEMAVQYQNENKERECLEIISQNKESVFASEAFIKMKFEDVCRIFEDLRQMGFLSEVQYLRSALKWMGQDIDTHKNKLLEKIQISNLSMDDFIDIVIDFPSFLTNFQISHAMKEIKSVPKSEEELRDRREEGENVAESAERSTDVGSLEDSENAAESGRNTDVGSLEDSENAAESGRSTDVGSLEDSENAAESGRSTDVGSREDSENTAEPGRSTDVGSREDRENAAESGYSSTVPDRPSKKNEISEKKTKLMISIVNEDDVKRASVIVEDEIGRRGLQFEIPGDMEGVFASLPAGDHTFDNVDISYEGLYFMMVCLRDVRAEMSSVNSIEAFKAAVYFQHQGMQDFLLMKIGNIVDYDPAFLDSLRCLPFFEDRFLQLVYSKPRCVILHPNFVTCSVELIETMLEQDELRLLNELQLLLVTIQWLEARNRLHWDSRSKLLNKIAFENISFTELLVVVKRYPRFCIDNEMNSILLYKNGINRDQHVPFLPEWYSFKSRRFVECE